MANPNGLNLPHHLMQLFFDSESESSDSESGFTGSAGPRINPMASCFFDLDSEDSSGVRGEDSIKAVEWRNRLFPSFTSEQFRCEFRVTRATFDFILSRIRSDLEKKAHEDKRGKPRTPAQFQLGMLLYYVATGQPLRTVGQLFAYGETTAGDSVHSDSFAKE
ncbi:hypothetical protein BCR33DRAFT_744015 [Rhizoclosmatium globosum]|uniref:Transposase Helix-turn-helix domain-containing protein n=1 Tax=Rhizoclosmatium globosum TaxID=329046 RepID=A0A1Y2BDE2_9FUNG|nr:hypothetical protein BCR33DRAFT_744015 [Rhizoclosmatium globosum]|eukprot:ORY32726.1 hypothetical protein BCR33DRAFT_744015 [Rhizoclosmatium globosum]